jgi:hypothetical protein
MGEPKNCENMNYSVQFVKRTVSTFHLVFVSSGPGQMMEITGWGEPNADPRPGDKRGVVCTSSIPIYIPTFSKYTIPSHE